MIQILSIIILCRRWHRVQLNQCERGSVLLHTKADVCEMTTKILLRVKSKKADNMSSVCTKSYC